MFLLSGIGFDFSWLIRSFKKGEKYDNNSDVVSDQIWIEFKVGQWSRAELNNL